MLVIVYSRPDGGVSVCSPAPKMLAFMTRPVAEPQIDEALAGRLAEIAMAAHVFEKEPADAERAAIQAELLGEARTVLRERQAASLAAARARLVAEETASGRAPDVAARYADAMLTGGLSEADAVALIGDRDCAEGQDRVVLDSAALPADRSQRNAWRLVSGAVVIAEAV